MSSRNKKRAVNKSLGRRISREERRFDSGAPPGLAEYMRISYRLMDVELKPFGRIRVLRRPVWVTRIAGELSLKLGYVLYIAKTDDADSESIKKCHSTSF